ncbi:uncharacterized protein G2W53_008713 [Senna tora]|uniref:Uncharacterized protein n=1 Tax=Senna tora TaxID=362788 RepID=A0A834X8A6_9FABA|nr:uncharacterized protein G2W53_008713 [Senna tora]
MYQFRTYDSIVQGNALNQEAQELLPALELIVSQMLFRSLLLLDPGVNADFVRNLGGICIRYWYAASLTF